MSAHAQAAAARRKLSIAGLSLNGILLFGTGVLVVASGFKSLRPDVGGLALHPSLVPIALAFPFVLMARIGDFPLRALVAMVLFFGMYCFSVLNGAGIALGEISKAASAFVTIVSCALLVRKRGDFVAGALGLNIAIAMLALHGLRNETVVGVEAMEGANKNSYSLFALPAMLLAAYVMLQFKTVPVWIKTLFMICVVAALAAIFMSGNRSGYLCAVLVGVMVFWNRRGKGLLLVALIAGVVGVGIAQFGDTTVLDRRLKQTVEGNSSDDMRVQIIVTCLKLGLENPVIGVSPQNLKFEIGRNIVFVFRQPMIDSHNVFAHVFAGSGIICFGALIAFGWALWTWKPRDGGPIGGKGTPRRETLRLVRMLLFLWIVRGLFTREIMYNPSFNIAFGLAIGLLILVDAAESKGQRVQAIPAA